MLELGTPQNTNSAVFVEHCFLLASPGSTYVEIMSNFPWHPNKSTLQESLCVTFKSIFCQSYVKFMQKGLYEMGKNLICVSPSPFEQCQKMQDWCFGASLALHQHWRPWGDGDRQRGECGRESGRSGSGCRRGVYLANVCGVQKFGRCIDSSICSATAWAWQCPLFNPFLHISPCQS